MRKVTVGDLLWPALAVVAIAAVVALILIFDVPWVTAIVVPVVVAVIGGWVVQRFPQWRQPVAVTAKVNDLDMVIADGTGVPASGHTVRLTVEATGPQTVLLDELRAVVVDRREASGRLAPHLGVVQPRPFELVLDHDPPVVRPLPGADHAHDFPFSVSTGDPEVIDLTVRTASGDVRWVLELDTICLGRRRTNRIDLGGRPFRTMARPQHPAEEERDHVT